MTARCHTIIFLCYAPSLYYLILRWSVKRCWGEKKQQIPLDQMTRPSVQFIGYTLHTSRVEQSSRNLISSDHRFSNSLSYGTHASLHLTILPYFLLVCKGAPSHAPAQSDYKIANAGDSACRDLEKEERRNKLCLYIQTIRSSSIVFRTGADVTVTIA